MGEGGSPTERDPASGGGVPPTERQPAEGANHYSLFQKSIVFSVNERENICIAGLNRRADYATDHDCKLPRS